MGVVEEFLAETLPRLEETDKALHNGNSELRKSMWSHNNPLTLFGAAFTKSGWDEISPIFDWLASRFSHCEAFTYEVVAADVSGDLAYIVGIEHTTASIGGAPGAPYSLRVTTIFRREDGAWKVIHRHADPMPESSPESSDATAEQLHRVLAERDAQ
ncbi:MAG TPA: nuclear transport factor 2 family protein [Ktedonobacterales bacterium]|jgi:ketosteroid isomerase-like protein|nr:nuclear transport factor 2 family protein [Ktedonobacterales bacterium]